MEGGLASPWGSKPQARPAAAHPTAAASTLPRVGRGSGKGEGAARQQRRARLPSLLIPRFGELLEGGGRRRGRAIHLILSKRGNESVAMPVARCVLCKHGGSITFFS